MKKHEDQLVVEAIRGNRDAVSKLMGMYFKDILYFAVSRMGGQEGEEIAQSAMLHIVRDISKLKEPGKFKSWMMSVVYHDCVDYMRKKKNKSKVFAEAELSEENLEDNRDFLPEEYVTDEEKRKMVLEVMQALPENYSDCMFLFYYQDMKYEDIAEALDISEHQVRNNLYRGKNLFKKKLETIAGKSFAFSVLPVGAVPMMTRVLQESTELVITPEMSGRVWANVENYIGTLILPTAAGTAVKTISTAKIAGSAVVIVASAGIAFGVWQHRSNVPAQTEIPKVEQQRRQAIPVIETEPMLEVPKVKESADVSTAAAIDTLEDLIGTEEAGILHRLSEGTVDEAEWQAFLERIGASVERTADEYDDTYTIYMLKKQDKQLMLAERKNRSTQAIHIIYEFGEQTETPLMLEVILKFQ